ncbi:hypothetical protein J7K50_05460 [bacterium]|nr:hypothetical protein [bacterium]
MSRIDQEWISSRVYFNKGAVRIIGGWLFAGNFAVDTSDFISKTADIPENAELSMFQNNYRFKKALQDSARDAGGEGVAGKVCPLVLFHDEALLVTNRFFVYHKDAYTADRVTAALFKEKPVESLRIEFKDGRFVEYRSVISRGLKSAHEAILKMMTAAREGNVEEEDATGDIVDDEAVRESDAVMDASVDSVMYISESDVSEPPADVGERVESDAEDAHSNDAIEAPPVDLPPEAITFPDFLIKSEETHAEPEPAAEPGGEDYYYAGKIGAVTNNRVVFRGSIWRLASLISAEMTEVPFFGDPAVKAKILALGISCIIFLPILPPVGVILLVILFVYMAKGSSTWKPRKKVEIRFRGGRTVSISDKPEYGEELPKFHKALKDALADRAAKRWS